MSRLCPFLPDGNPRTFNQPVVTDRCDRVMFPQQGKRAFGMRATALSDAGYAIFRNTLRGVLPSFQISDSPDR